MLVMEKCSLVGISPRVHQFRGVFSYSSQQMGLVKLSNLNPIYTHGKLFIMFDRGKGVEGEKPPLG